MSADAMHEEQDIRNYEDTNQYDLPDNDSDVEMLGDVLAGSAPVMMPHVGADMQEVADDMRERLAETRRYVNSY